MRMELFETGGLPIFRFTSAPNIAFRASKLCAIRPTISLRYLSFSGRLGVQAYAQLRNNPSLGGVQCELCHYCFSPRGCRPAARSRANFE